MPCTPSLAETASAAMGWSLRGDRARRPGRSFRARSASPSGRQRQQKVRRSANARCRFSHIAHRRFGVTAAHSGRTTRYLISSQVVAHVTADPCARMGTAARKARVPSLTRFRVRTDRSCSCYRSASMTERRAACQRPHNGDRGGAFVEHRAHEALLDSAPLAARGDIADDQRPRGCVLRPAERDCILQGIMEQHGIGASARVPFSWTGRTASRTRRAGPSDTMTPGAFIAKWRASKLKESSASQEHFIDLCRLLGDRPSPAAALGQRQVGAVIFVENRHALDDSAWQNALPAPLRDLDSMGMMIPMSPIPRLGRTLTGRVRADAHGSRLKKRQGSSNDGRSLFRMEPCNGGSGNMDRPPSLPDMPRRFTRDNASYRAQ